MLLDCWLLDCWYVVGLQSPTDLTIRLHLDMHDDVQHAIHARMHSIRRRADVRYVTPKELASLDPALRPDPAPAHERSYYLDWIRTDLAPWKAAGGITKVTQD